MKPYTQLITTNELSTILSDSKLILLDASIPPIGNVAPAEHSWPEYVIPEAKQFNLKEDFSDPQSNLSHTLPSVEQFQLSARQLGVNNDSQIVIYDHLGIYSSARAWWMFKAMGHKHVAVLDGGLPKWMSEGKATQKAKKVSIVQGNFVAQFQKGYFCNADFVLNNLYNPDKTIIDARATLRFLGNTDEPRAGVRSGHIPEAKNLPYSDLLINGCFNSKSALRTIFQEYTDADNSLIFSCGSGITACILALAADIIGYKSLCVYDGSWAEWGSDDKFPIERG
ncbi:sulfurtransferase [Colwelliaceae bacterium 6441]